MTLYQKLEGDMKAALKDGDSLRLSALRMLISAVKTFELEKKSGKVEEAEIIQILQRQIKQHRESIDQFRKGNRQDLADKEARELEILESYMPKQLEESEIMAVIKEAIKETGASTKADMGNLMKAVMDKVKGRADGKLVNRLVMESLNPSTGSGLSPEH